MEKAIQNFSDMEYNLTKQCTTSLKSFSIQQGQGEISNNNKNIRKKEKQVHDDASNNICFQKEIKALNTFSSSQKKDEENPQLVVFIQKMRRTTELLDHRKDPTSKISNSTYKQLSPVLARGNCSAPPDWTSLSS